ncbi:MAG: hypothetical protein H6532_04470 [Thermoleophilales bacterium]|nr:hypothetical protein [Thermoleophilales bacterium]
MAEEIGGPVVVKSQVLVGGRMKAGGVKFADTPAEAAAHALEILELEISNHMPVGVLVDPKAEVEHEYYAAVLWDGRARRPMMLFSDMGGIDIEQVAEEHPEHVGRGHLSNLHPIADFQAKQVIAATGVTGSQLNRATPILAKLARLFPRLRHDPRRDQPSRQALRRLLRRARRAHGDGGRGRRPPQEGPDRARRRPLRAARDVRAERLRAQRQGDRRGRPSRRHPGQRPRLHRQHRARDRRRRRVAHPHRRGSQPGRQARQLRRDRRQPLGVEVVRPRQGDPAEGRRREDRRDDVDRLQHPGRHRRPRRHQGLPRAR